MNLSLDGKVAVVTGASRGIGKSIAEALYAEGMKVVVCARSQDLLTEITRRDSERFRSLACDLQQASSPELLIDFAIKEFGRIDVLVNNVGSTQRGDFLELSDTQWNEGFNLKFYSTVRCTRHAWSHLVGSQGTVINIIGIGGRIGSIDFAIGGAVNSALMNLTKTLAQKGLVDKVRVNGINPGTIRTERLERRIANISKSREISYLDAEIVLKKELGVLDFGSPKDIANVVCFLASPLACYVQGTIIDVDGGSLKSL